MNRRMLCLILALMLCLSLVACGGRQSAAAPKEENAAASAETPAATDAAGNPVEAPEAAQEKTDAPGTASEAEEETKPAFQPGVDTTLPPEVDAELGVEDDDTPALEDIPGESTSGNTPVSQPESTPSQIGDDFNLEELDYEGYHALSGADQQKVIAMFGSPDDFIRWYKAVEAQYKAEHPDIEIGADGAFDAGTLGG